MSSRKKGPIRKRDLDDDASLSTMFAEYREENAKDMEREAIGSW